MNYSVIKMSAKLFTFVITYVLRGKQKRASIKATSFRGAPTVALVVHGILEKSISQIKRK